MSNDKKSIKIKQVQIHQVRGFGRGDGFSVDSFSPGINIIYGPNASGKSTTACAVQELIWPGKTGLSRAVLTGEFLEEETRWHVDIDIDRVEVLRDGEKETIPVFAPAEMRHKYHLALHDLLQADTTNADFAKSIFDASQGGYDLAAASADLEFKPNPKPKNKLRKELNQSKQRVKELQNRQSNLNEKQNELAGLEAEFNRCIEAESRANRLRAIQTLHESVARYQAASERLASFPEQLNQMTGEEINQLDRIRGNKKRLETDLRQKQGELESATSELAKDKELEMAVDFDVLTQLRGEQQRLATIENKLDNGYEALQRYEAKECQALSVLGEHFSTDQLAGMSRIPLDDVDEIVSQAEDLRSKTALIEDEERWLEKSRCEGIDGLEEHVVQRGIEALSRWLTSLDAGYAGGEWKSLFGPLRWGSIVGACAGIGMAVALGELVHPGLYGLAAIPLVILLIDFLVNRHRYQGGPVKVREYSMDSYRETGLEEPEDWNPEQVKIQMEALFHLQSKLVIEAHRQQRLDALEKLKSESDKLSHQLEVKVSRVQDSLGLKLGENLEIHWMSRLVYHINQWQESVENKTGEEAHINKLLDDQKSVLNTINLLFGKAGYKAEDSSEKILHQVEKIASRLEVVKDTRKSIAVCNERIDEIQKALKSLENEEVQVFGKVGLDAGSEQKLVQWMQQLPDFLREKAERGSRFAVMEDRKKEVGEMDESESRLSGEDLESEMEKQSSLAASRDTLNSEITQIKNDIRHAMSEHDLEDAIDEFERLKAEMEEEREARRMSVVGFELTRWIREVAVNKARPTVFTRANELLGKFTQYQLQLELQDSGENAEFMARRAQSHSGRLSSLNELSVGERVQLLIAVRVAFLEQDESSMLPLILDEVLGTSDDERASRIMQAVIEIARTGRQVLYFTAQSDEVGKWKDVINQSGNGIPYSEFDLHAIRTKCKPERIVPKAHASLIAQFPEPGGRGKDEYAELIGVGGFDPVYQDPGDLHLWYLVDKPGDLYSFLKHGIEKLGQIEILESAGATRLVSSDLFDRVKAQGIVFSEACKLWALGRGKPLDREALVNCDAVSNAFVDTLHQIAEDNNGDAEAVMSAIENKDVKRWRQDNTDDLRNYFLDHGYLSPDEPVPVHELRIRVLARAGKFLELGIINESRIDALVELLFNNE